MAQLTTLGEGEPILGATLRHQSKFYLPVTRTARYSFIVYGLNNYLYYLTPISNDTNILCCVCFYFVALDVSLGFHFLLYVCYVNPAYGCQIEINCMYEIRLAAAFENWATRISAT